MNEEEYNDLIKELDKPLTVEDLLKIYINRFDFHYQKLIFKYLNRELNKEEIKEIKFRIHEILYAIDKIDYDKYNELNNKYKNKFEI